LRSVIQLDQKWLTAGVMTSDQRPKALLRKSAAAAICSWRSHDSTIQPMMRNALCSSKPWIGSIAAILTNARLSFSDQKDEQCRYDHASALRFAGAPREDRT